MFENSKTIDQKMITVESIQLSLSTIRIEYIQRRQRNFTEPRRWNTRTESKKVKVKYTELEDKLELVENQISCYK